MPKLTDATLVSEVTEQQILAWITDRVRLPHRGDTTLLGIGDDAAVIRPQGDTVVTTDTLVHGPDFRLVWSSGYDIGWKSVAVNVADVAAMGATPTALLVALTLPPQTTLGFLAEFYRGIGDACDALAPACSVVGGDLTVSGTLTIAITALGDLEGRNAVTRSGARPGDVVALAGTQGVSVVGLDILFRRFRDADGTPIPVDVSSLTPEESDQIAAQLRPHPDVDAGAAAAAAGATAMMDVSDGLVLDARRIAIASGVLIDFDSSALGADPRAALVGGEDHALLATFPPDAVLPQAFRAVGLIHAAAEGAAGTVTIDGAAFSERGGWDPYQDWDDRAG